MPSERDCLAMVERIENSLVVLHSSRAFYREYQEILRGNHRLPPPNHFLVWIADNYLYSAAMSLRRLLDGRNDTISIYKLLDALRRNPQLLTKESYIARFTTDGTDRDMAEEAFAMLTGTPQARGLNLDELRSQLNISNENWQRLKRYIDQRIAHEARNPDRTIPTVTDLDRCIDNCAEVMRKIICFMTCRNILSFEPVMQYPWREVFSFPWIEPPG